MSGAKQPTGTEFSHTPQMKILADRVRHLFVSDSLMARCAKGSVSLMAGTGASKVIAFVSKIVLAKLLIAEERGLMIIILPLVTFFETLTEIGIKQSVIQNKNGATEAYLNMAWWIQSIRGVVLYLGAYLISPFLCSIWVYGKVSAELGYSQTELLWMVRIAFLTILLNGLISPRSNVLLKEFKFGRSVVLVQGSAALSGVLTIVLALVFRNVWAFVVGTVSQYLFLCLFSYLMCPFRPKRAYHAESLRSLIKFSRGMLGLPILTYLAFNMDVLIGSLYVSPAIIGMYGFALILARTPREIMTRIFGPLLIPAYAEKQDDPQAVCRGVIWITRMLALIVFPLTAYLIMCRESILTILYKPDFKDITVPFSLLCITYAILLQEFPLGKVFFGLGEPGKHRVYVLIRAALLAALIFPAVKLYGMTGVAAALLFSNAAAYWYQVAALRKMIGLDIVSYLNAWIPGVVTAMVYTVVLSAVFVVWPESLWHQFLTGAILLVIFLAGVSGISLVRSNLLYRAQYSSSL